MASRAAIEGAQCRPVLRLPLTQYATWLVPRMTSAGQGGVQGWGAGRDVNVNSQDRPLALPCVRP